MLADVIDHIRNRTYMSGVNRTQVRVMATGEVFTPTELVREMLEQLPISQFQDPAKTFLDNSCGDGQFLGEVLIRKMENGSTFEEALSTIYGVDLMKDNVELCRERLLCGQEQFRHIVERNIVCNNALTYDYSFNGTNFTDKELLDQQLGISEISKSKTIKSKKSKPKPIDTLNFFS
jgi:type I restriction-modification system DNA methylase subunit